VTLEDIRPPIWRRIQVRGDITLYKLHEILQVVMDWEGYHLHQFMVGEESYSEISKESDILADELKQLRTRSILSMSTCWSGLEGSSTLKSSI
jgi:hypothetical protein